MNVNDSYEITTEFIHKPTQHHTHARHALLPELEPPDLDACACECACSWSGLVQMASGIFAISADGTDVTAEGALARAPISLV